MYHFSTTDIADLDERQVDAYLAQIAQVEEFRAQFVGMSVAMGSSLRPR